MATHSSVLAWRTPAMAELGELPSMGSHRVGNWTRLKGFSSSSSSMYISIPFSLPQAIFFFSFQFWLTHGLLLGYFLPLCVIYISLSSPSNAFFHVNLLEKNLIYCGNLVTTWEVLDMGQKFCPPWTVNNKGLWDTNIWCLLWSSLLIVGREQSVSRYPQSFLFTPGKSWGKIIHEIPILLKSKTSVETQECCWMNSLT